jgi:hypothetical protein
MRTIKANTDLLSYILTMIGFEKTFVFNQKNIICFDNNPSFPNVKMHQDDKHLILIIHEIELDKIDYADFCNFVSQDGDEVSLGLDFLLKAFSKIVDKVNKKLQQFNVNK